MAAVQSLGVHTPLALPYLVAEGILPPDPKPDQYQWESYSVDDGAHEVEEEILATKNAVAWSQGKFIQNVYRFNPEGEDVVQAITTRFPTSARVRNQPNVDTNDAESKLRISTGSNGTVMNGGLASPDAFSRALVVLLKSKAHVYFLHGSSDIIDLPFEVERAFAAPRGLVLQRKRTARPSIPPTPQLPAAPPNSFFSSQGLPGSSLRYSVSPTLVKSFARTSFMQKKPPERSQLNGNPKLDALFQDVIATPIGTGDDDITNLYTMSDPLAELGVVTYAMQQYRPRILNKSRAGPSIEFEGLDPAERVIYVSSRNELSSSRRDTSSDVMLLLTFNADISTVTIWHAWYTDGKPLQSLLKMRADQKAAKARRRSSFMSTTAGTGAATPAIRRRDGTRESFAAPGQLQPDLNASQGGGLSRKPTRQEEEEAMASQMDPDFLPKGSQTVTRENRRISSMNTDVRASQTTVSASFAATAGRRTTSFGGTHGRRSLSHRKSRGSTPGSSYGHSLATEDDSMDLDSTVEFDTDESVDEIIKHVRATFEASGMDSVFGSADEGFKRELIVRKLHSFPVGLSSSQRSPTGTGESYRVVTLSEPLSYTSSGDAKLRIYVHDRGNGNVHCTTFKVKRRQLWSQSDLSETFAIPFLVEETQIGRVDDVAKINDNGLSAILLGRDRAVLSLDDQQDCVIPSGTPYRFYDLQDQAVQHDHADKEVGKNRTLTPPSGPARIHKSGLKATFDLVGNDQTLHRRGLTFRPPNDSVDDLLGMYELILPKQQARSVRRLWCTAYAWLNEHQESMKGTLCGVDVLALATTTFVFVIGLLDSKARAALNVAKVAAGNSETMKTNTLQMHKSSRGQRISARPAWAWMEQQRPQSSSSPGGEDGTYRDHFLVIAAALADELYASAMRATEPTASVATICALRLMIGLHIVREEGKLCSLLSPSQQSVHVAAMIAQIGSWLGLADWTSEPNTYYGLEAASSNQWLYVKSTIATSPRLDIFQQPVGVLQWFGHSLQLDSPERYPDLSTIAAIGTDASPGLGSDAVANKYTPRTAALSDVLTATASLKASPIKIAEILAERDITVEALETYPQSIAATFREALTRCEKQPPTTWSPNLLDLVGRDDLNVGSPEKDTGPKTQPALAPISRDTLATCNALEHPPAHARTKEAGRHAVSQLIFNEDRRLVEATSLMHFNSVQIAQCPRQPEWDEATHFEQQRKVMHFVTLRMISLPAGDGMIHYDSQTPLLTEKYHLPGFNSSCLMQPMGHTLTTDRSGLTEEKVNWAYFHAGVSAGLRISHNVKGIDTSWIAFNKPNDLTNRHAGLLLALGLGGHLRQLAKWLSFKYLTPKHTMTSVGLLLGLSASYIGTMDGLITRMLSVHITRMLPPGAAELNVSPATQTAGLMGIGLLYHNTQHRRMTEIMISEIEYLEVEDPDSGPDPLRDESYRLAAGFALGLINLGKGSDLRGLHGMKITERLLAVAIGPRPVNAVHVFDRATAGAVIAIALVFMKTGDVTVAKKVDIPDTEAQFDQVRPDILMLRAMAKHIILWDGIEAQGVRMGMPGWIQDNLPACYQNRSQQVLEHMLAKHTIDSAHIPLFNVYTGLAFALALKYAGSGNELARDEVLALLKFFHSLGESADAYYFDGKLGRASLRRCMDVLALCASMVMAGTGDLETFRFLRRMHGRTDADTPYGSHLAAHLAIGTLFLAGGTFTFGTSNLAVASLMCSFYPLLPTDVHDNRVHLQAFRHLWVFAAEARCIVFEDIDTQRPIHMPIRVTLRSGMTKDMKSPCLLPELDTIATVQTSDPSYWPVTLDFANNASHLASFRKNQRIYVRRCPAAEAYSSVFSATLASQALPAATDNSLWQSLFKLKAFEDLDKADIELVLPPDVNSSLYLNERTTVVDDKLVLAKATRSVERDELWDLRVLFSWAGRNGRLEWLGEEVVEGLKARIEERARG